MGESHEQLEQRPETGPHFAGYSLFMRGQVAGHDAAHYDPCAFAVLAPDIQRRHLWQRGRQRFSETAARNEDARWALVEKTHAVPAAPVNGLLEGIFSLEGPLSGVLRFPWGTSLLGVSRRPT